MKIFWFTNIMMPDLSLTLAKRQEVVGGWMPSLLDAMRDSTDVEFAIATIDLEVERLISHKVGGVTYFRLPHPRTKSTLLPAAFVDACTNAISTYQPDIIHVHGTENVYGLFTTLPACTRPAVISIQGLIHAYSRHLRGGLSLRDYYAAGKVGILAWLRYLLQEYQWTLRGRVEESMIANNSHFIGRTIWDKAHILAINPAAQYYHCEECLRPPFFASRWDLRNISRYTIFCTAAHSPIKGFHWLLQAVALLCHEFPHINVRVAGAPWDKNRGFGYYGRYIKKLIETHDLSHHITPLPALDAADVAKELRKTHAFAIPSLIENSPNSLAEAMLVGTPSIAAFVGGIPSMIDDGETALSFPQGDAAYLAHCIRRIFTDDTLAQHLSTSARAAALDRQDPKHIVTRQLDIYRQIISGAGKS